MITSEDVNKDLIPLDQQCNAELLKGKVELLTTEMTLLKVQVEICTSCSCELYDYKEWRPLGCYTLWLL
jgi:hypothetical protein